MTLPDIIYEVKVEIIFFESANDIVYHHCFDSEIEMVNAFKMFGELATKMTSSICSPIAAVNVYMIKTDNEIFKTYMWKKHFQFGNNKEVEKYDNN